MKRIVGASVALGLLCGLLSSALADEGAGSVSDDQFVAKASASGATEVELGKMALQRAQRAEIKAYGEQIVRDHAAANRELLALAARKQITVPQKVEPKQQEVIDKLAKITGAEFDRAFTSQMIKDHKEAVALYRSESERGKDPDLKAYATKVLPTVQEHLRLVRQWGDEEGSSSKSAARD